MSVKEILKSSIEGSGEVAKSLMGTVTGLVKEGTGDIGELFGAVIDLGKEGVVDVTEGTKDVYVASVKALEESGQTTEEAITTVTTKAEEAIGAIGEGGAESVGDAAKKGIEEAKGIVTKPFEK